MHAQDVFHEGEKLVQQKAGEQQVALRNGRAINTSIMPGALKFIAQQPMAILGSIDSQDNVWASVMTGTSGFVTAPDERTVMFDLTNAGAHAHDPLWTNIERNANVGMLLIEPASRRRLRINGQISRPTPNGLRVDVDEAYPNCPQYIQRRHLHPGNIDPATTPGGPIQSGDAFTTAQRKWVAAADTFFVASVHPQRGTDVSHRGGQPGFVRVLDDRTLRVPDYAGNSMFNTLGNFQSNPRAGLVFVDFDTARVLQMTGKPIIRWDLAEDDNQPTGGTRRYWDFTVEHWLTADMSYPLQTEFLDYWDRNPQPA